MNHERQTALPAAGFGAVDGSGQRCFPTDAGPLPPLPRLQLADTRLETGSRSILVNPVPSDLQVNLELDRRGPNPIYRPGEPISITLSTNRDAYVYLFSIQADGRTHLILPNRFSGGNEFLRAGEVRTFPPPVPATA